MVKPIYAQAVTLTGKVGPRLMQALRWWLHVLDHDVSERRDWVLADEAPCFIFVDAASIPARSAAVLVRDGVMEFTDGEPTVAMMCQLKARRDKQIMSLVCCLKSCIETVVLTFVWQEIMAIMVALSTFADEVKGRKVIPLW